MGIKAPVNTSDLGAVAGFAIGVILVVAVAKKVPFVKTLV